MTELGERALDDSAPYGLSESACQEALALAVSIGNNPFFWSRFGGWKWGNKRDDDDVSEGYDDMECLAASLTDPLAI